LSHAQDAHGWICEADYSAQFLLDLQQRFASHGPANRCAARIDARKNVAARCLKRAHDPRRSIRVLAFGSDTDLHEDA